MHSWQGLLYAFADDDAVCGDWQLLPAAYNCTLSVVKVQVELRVAQLVPYSLQVHCGSIAGACNMTVLGASACTPACSNHRARCGCTSFTVGCIECAACCYLWFSLG